MTAFLDVSRKHLHWTQHAKQKLKYYGLSEQRIKRILRHPARMEEGIAPNTVAVMQQIVKNEKTTQEIWSMYQDRGNKRIIITAWRYPGKSPVRGPLPIPDTIAKELSSVMLGM